MILDSVNKSIQIVLGAAITTNQASFMADWVDNTSTTFTPGSNDGPSNGTTAVTIVPAPAASTQRQVKFFSVFNADSAPMVVTVQLLNSGTVRKIYAPTLQPGYTLSFTDGDFTVTDVNGAVQSAFSGASTGSGAYVLTNAPTITNPNIVGVSTATNAASGSVGEFLSANGSGVNVPTATNTNVASLALSAGDWDVTGTVLLSTSAVSIAAAQAGLDSTSATLPVAPGYSSYQGTAIANYSAVVPPLRLLLAAPATVYLVANATYGSGTCTAYSNISARRRR